jgi:hypothetical protein
MLEICYVMCKFPNLLGILLSFLRWHLPKNRIESSDSTCFIIEELTLQLNVERNRRLLQHYHVLMKSDFLQAIFCNSGSCFPFGFQ